MEAMTEIQDSPKTAFVFPGQGAQFVGMGKELYESCQAAKDVFDEVDNTLSFPLSRLIFEGPSDQLQATANSQPAIAATSLACLKALGEYHSRTSDLPVAMAGHSVGEYTSLIVSGALGVAEGISLVRERGRLMQEASELRPGSMAAIIGLDEVIVDEICHETGAEVANINGADQIVVSGTRLCLARAVDMASIRGARKAIPLAVSGAFHSSLMAYAQEGLETAVDGTNLRDPAVAIFANATSNPISTAKEIREELVVQLCSCVQWKKSICNMIDSGVSRFVELGPGKVLSGLIRRIGSSEAYKDRHIEVIPLGDLSSIRNAIEGGLWSRSNGHSQLAT